MIEMRHRILVFSLFCMAVAAAIILSEHVTDRSQWSSDPQVIRSSPSPWDIPRYHVRRNSSPQTTAEDGFSVLPFTSLGGKESSTVGDVYINDQYQSRFVGSDFDVAFPFPGVPIDLKIINSNYHFAYRRVFDGTLFHLTYDLAGRLLKQQIVNLEGVDFPIFRTSAVGAGVLYWVVYDNKKRKNYLISLDQEHGAGNLTVELPTFYPPAGGTYEMEAPVFLSGDKKFGFELVAGALYAKIKDGKVEGRRIENCEVVIETIFTSDGPAVLCRTLPGASTSYLLTILNKEHANYLDASKGIPWKLQYDAVDGAVSVSYARSAKEISDLFLRDLREGQQSGVLEFGIDNTEGRIPWSQIYYLNGLMDLLLLIDVNKDAQAVFGRVSNDLVSRITLEVRSLDDLLDREEGFYTKGFTHDRSAALFAVQTSRLLLLFDRYAEELPGAPRLENTQKLRNMVASLDGHIDQLAYEGERESWMRPGTAHLRWPKCSAFYFDGMPVPFNHQNEWAYSLFNAASIRGENTDSPELNDQRDIIKFFMERLGDRGGFPSTDKWFYWYGHAYDGWAATDDRSCNTPSYPGDHGLAWISFRTIDFMSVMSAVDFVPGLKNKKLFKSAVEAVKRGDVYPFASRSLLAVGEAPQIQIPVLERYYRATAPWEISNTPWALVMGFSENQSADNQLSLE